MTPCIETIGHRIAGGYRRIQRNHRRVLEHRYAWELAHGPIPDGLDVLHRCDNPACSNVEHLFLGTHQENMRDRNAKGRQAVGERVGSHKLTEAAVRDIRTRHTGRYGEVTAMARQYGVDRRTIHCVLSKEMWSHCG